MPENQLHLRALAGDDKVTRFSLGDADFQPLKRFLNAEAKAYHAASLAKTYVFVDDAASVAAYITLISAEITTEIPINLAAPEISYRYKSYPAVKIARLAVDKRYRSLGLGRQLVTFALGLVTEAICPNIGCRIVVVDAKKKSVEFYRKCGFTLLDTPHNKALSEPVMFLDVLKAASAANEAPDTGGTEASGSEGGGEPAQRQGSQ